MYARMSEHSRQSTGQLVRAIPLPRVCTGRIEDSAGKHSTAKDSYSSYEHRATTHIQVQSARVHSNIARQIHPHSEKQGIPESVGAESVRTAAVFHMEGSGHYWFQVPG
jgi:hypothetical protein